VGVFMLPKYANFEYANFGLFRAAQKVSIFTGITWNACYLLVGGD
jgi:hypothetical protein